MTDALKNRRLAWRLTLAAAAMCGFGYLLVPLYEVYCQATGFNGTTGRRLDYGEAVARKEDAGRTVTVEFVANTNGTLPWEFRPETARLRVHPGQLVLTRFHAHNLAHVAIVGQAIPSVTPNQAAPYFHKIECFCFSRQPLGPGEGKELPLQFLVDPELPKDITTLTLSYTFFETPGIQADEDSRPKPVGVLARR